MLDLERYIDYTLLKPDITRADVIQLCKTAVERNFKAVCIPPYFVKEAFQQLQNSNTKVATVIGFPMGYSATHAKVEEMKRALEEGADELDCVINIAAIKDAAWTFVRNDMDSMIRTAHLKGKVVKIILETGLLTPEEITKLCEFATEYAVDFVKTSTGINGSGATPSIIKALRSQLPDSIKIKASGGIRTKEAALEMIAAGADRVGTSSLF